MFEIQQCDCVETDCYCYVTRFILLFPFPLTPNRAFIPHPPPCFIIHFPLPMDARFNYKAGATIIFCRNRNENRPLCLSITGWRLDVSREELASSCGDDAYEACEGGYGRTGTYKA